MAQESKAFPASSKTRVPLALMLAAIAGTADSIGFLEFSQLFMSFMSGNTTRFGVAVSSEDWEGAFRFGSVIAVFCFGAFIGTLFAAWAGQWRLAVLLGIQALLFSAGVVVPQGSNAVPLHAYPIALALGIQNATLQDEAGRSLALTYVTGTVVRFGAGVANILLHKPAPSFWIQAPLWASLTAGAIFGGILHRFYGESAFLVVAGVACALALVAFVLTLALHGSRYTSGEAPQPDAHPDTPHSATILR